LCIGWADGLAITAGNKVSGSMDLGATTALLYVHSATTGATAMTINNVTADGGFSFTATYTV
jgi:hypothetical protein